MSDGEELAAEVRRLRTEVDALRRRVADLEVADEDTDPDPARTATEPDAKTDAEPGTPGAAEPDHRSPSVESSVREGRTAARDTDRDWERDLGVKWLGLVGGIALVVGVVLFIRLAIQIGLLGPLGRVVVGTVGGLALFAGGRIVAERQGYVRWGRIAAGVGLAIAYFSCYAAYGFETYRTALGTPLWTVLLALTALVAGTAIVSVRDGAPIVAGEAFFLGYGTAFLGLEAETFVVTPAYALVLAAGLVAIAIARPWRRLVVGSVLPTYGLVVAWFAEIDPEPGLFAGVITVAFGIYLVGDYVLRRGDADGRWHSLQLGTLTVLNAVIAASYLEDAVRELALDAPVEGIAFVAVGLALVGVYVITDRRPVRRDETAGALAVVLFGTAVVLAAGFRTFAATVGLLALVCGAVFVASRRDAAAVRTGGHLVAAGVVVKLLAIDANALAAFDPATPLSTLTGRPTAFALGIGVFYGLAWWFRDEAVATPRAIDPIPLAAAYSLAATGLTVVVSGLELSGAAVSVAWAAFGLALVTAGLATDLRGLRFQGIVVLALATGKVFLFDTQGLEPVARVLAYLVVGAVLLVASYAYARRQGEDPLRRLTSE